MAGYFGDPGQGESAADVLGQLMPIYHQIKNRELDDFQKKGQIAQDLAVRQENLRKVFDPAGQGGQGRTTNPNISYGITAPNPEIATTAPPSLTPAEQAKFGLEKGQLELEGKKVAQTGKIGEERLGIIQQQADISRQKEKDIHETKISDMQRKADEATQRMGMAYDKLQQQGDNANAHLEFLKAKDAADQARHALELTQRDKQIADQQGLHAAQIDELRKRHENDLKTIGYEYDENGKLIKSTEQKQPAPKTGALSSSTTKRFTTKQFPKGLDIPMDKLDQFKTENPDAQEVKSR